MSPYILALAVAFNAILIHNLTRLFVGARSDMQPGGTILGTLMLYLVNMPDAYNEWWPTLPLLLVTAAGAHMLSVKARRTLDNKRATK